MPTPKLIRTRPLQGYPSTKTIPLAAGAIIHQGTLVAQDSNDNLVLAGDALGLTFTGVAYSHGDSYRYNAIDNSDGAAGRYKADVMRHIFWLNNSQTQPVAAADLGKQVFAEDELTVAKETTHSLAVGVALAVTASQVLVWIPPEDLAQIPGVRILGEEPEE
jgi:hypothetical protein